MATVPNTILGRIQFFEQHLPLWAVDPVAIGLTALEVAALTSETAQARSDFESAQDLRLAARVGTDIQTLSVASMYDLGSGFLKTIRAFAEKTDDPNVYTAAGIPGPQPPTPAGPPDQPTDLEADVRLPFGLKLKWKGSVSQSAYFSIWRKLSTETSYSMIKTTSDKSFEDVTVPGGIDSVSYYIAARRDDFTVNGASLSISFGADGTTSMTLAA
jgi:hypothetical protein